MLNTTSELARFNDISQALEQDRAAVLQAIAAGNARERRAAMRRFVQRLEKYIEDLETWHDALQANIQYVYKRDGFGIPKEGDPAWELIKKTNAWALLLSLRADKKEYEARLQEPVRQSNASLTAAKLMLSLSEAAEISGLPRSYLRQAISEGELKAKIIGKGWRVKRSDLNAYVETL